MRIFDRLFRFPNNHSDRKLTSFLPLPFCALAFGIGIVASNYLSLPFVLTAFSAFVLLVLFFLAAKSRFSFFFGVLIFFVLGNLAGTNNRTVSERSIALAPLEGRIVLEGIVISTPEIVVKGKKETVSFVVDSLNIFHNEFLDEVRGKVQVFLYNPARLICFGDKLRLRGVLETPKPARNPHSFDYADYLANHEIFKIFRGIGKYSVIYQQPGYADDPQ